MTADRRLAEYALMMRGLYAMRDAADRPVPEDLAHERETNESYSRLVNASRGDHVREYEYALRRRDGGAA